MGQEPTPHGLGRENEVWSQSLNFTRKRVRGSSQRDHCKSALCRSWKLGRRSEVKVRQDYETRAGITNQKHLNCSNNGVFLRKPLFLQLLLE